MARNIRMGDYIHWRYSSYVQNGLTINSGHGVKRADMIKIFQEQRQHALSLCPRQDMSQSLKDLENKLNFFYGSKDGVVINTAFTEEQNAAIQAYMRQVIERTLNEMYPNLAQSAIADYSNLGATKITGDTTSRTSKDLSKRRSAVNFNRQGQTYTTYGALYKSIQALTEFRDVLGKNIKTNVDQDLISKVDELSTKYENFITEVNSTVKSDTKYSGKDSKKHISFSASKTDANGNAFMVGDFAREVQSLVDMTKQATSTALEGVLGEIAPAAIMEVWEHFQQVAAEDLAEELANLNQQDIIVNLVKGQAKIAQQRTRKVTTANKIIAKKGLSGEMRAQVGNAKVSTTYTQDKVDIELNVGGGEIVNVSAKNINLNSGYNISLLSGANLVNYLQDYPEFVNHYLNVTANAVENDPDPNDGYFSDRVAHLGQPVIAARDSMKMTIALHALVGGVIGQAKGGGISRSAKAALFLVNDNSTGRFSVYSTYDLLEKIDKNLKYLKVEGIPDQWTNRWIGEERNLTNAFARSASILAQMHETKLKVSLDPAILKT